jgi:hypothetical protein
MRDLSTQLSTVTPWSSDWAWSVPLIVITVVFHAYGLGLLNHRAGFILRGNRKSRLARVLPMLVVGTSALWATILHAFEASMWAAAYFLLGALPDRKGSILYSLGAMTTYGQSGLYLEPRWRLMGSLEALDGWILFGLTTAFMFGVIQRVWIDRDHLTQPGVR